MPYAEYRRQATARYGVTLRQPTQQESARRVEQERPVERVEEQDLSNPPEYQALADEIDRENAIYRKGIELSNQAADARQSQLDEYNRLVAPTEREIESLQGSVSSEKEEQLREIEDTRQKAKAEIEVYRQKAKDTEREAQEYSNLSSARLAALREGSPIPPAEVKERLAEIRGVAPKAEPVMESDESYKARQDAALSNWENDLKQADPEGYRIYKEHGENAYQLSVSQRNSDADREYKAAVTENERIEADNKRIVAQNITELMAIPNLDGEVYGQELANDYRRGVESGDMSTFENRLKEYNEKVDTQVKLQGEQTKKDIAELRTIPNSGDYLASLYEKAARTGDDADYATYKKAVDNYNDIVDVKIKEAEASNADYDRFVAQNTQLPDGAWMPKTELATIQKETPKLYQSLTEKGYDKTYGYLNELEKSNPKLYVAAMVQYGALPENSEYFDTLPDGTIRTVDKEKPDYGPKTVGELSKKIGVEIATAFVPGVWAKDLKIERDEKGNLASNMPAWEIGLNIGTDLLVLIPVAGWGAKAVGKAILKSGTMTIEKSLAKELPKALIKAGEKGLAVEARTVAKALPQIQKAAEKMEKAAINTVKVVNASPGNIKALAKAVKLEQKTKQTFITTFQKFGNDVAELNAKVAYTSVRSVGNEGLAKTVGLAKDAPDFAEYITGSAKDLAKAQINAKYFGKTTPSTGAKIAKETDQAIRAYMEVPKTIGEVSGAMVRVVKPERLSIKQVSRMSDKDWVKWAQKTWKGRDIPTEAVTSIETISGTKARAVFRSGAAHPKGKIEVIYKSPQQAVKDYLHELGHARTLQPRGKNEIVNFVNKQNLKYPSRVKEAQDAIAEMAAEHAMRIQGLTPVGKDYIKIYKRVIQRLTDKTTAKQAEELAVKLAKESVKRGPQVELRVFGKQILTSGKPVIEAKFGGLRAGAAYLGSGQGVTKKILNPTQLEMMGKKKADAYLKTLQSQLAKDGAAGRAKAEKYLGKQTTLDKWDEFIQDSVNKKSPYEAGRPSIWGRGGVSTITGTGGGAGVKPKLSPAKQGESFVLRAVGGKALFTVVTNADGEISVIREAERISAPTKTPVEVPSRAPTRAPTKLPSAPTTKPSIKPGVKPTVAPSKTPSKAPSEMPVISPVKVPEKVPTRAPEKTPTKAPEKVPTRTPERTPERVPERVPEKNLIRVPEKALIKTPVKPPVRPPVKPRTPLLPPTLSPDMSDSEKREAIKASGGAFTWQQGELRGQKVNHVVVAPFRPSDKTTVMGRPPAGATQVSGKEQAKETIRLTRGEAPKKPVEYEGGAIDPVVFPITDKRVGIRFMKDATNRTPLRKFTKARDKDLGNGIVLSRRSGRKIRHLRLY